MSNKVTAEVEYIDDDHVFVNGSQFISLRRFNKMKREMNIEETILNDKNNQLIEENKAYRTLLGVKITGEKESE